MEKGSIDSFSFLQKLRVVHGYKVSESPASKRVKIKFQTVVDFFLRSLTKDECQKIWKDLHPLTKRPADFTEIAKWCAEVLNETLLNDSVYTVQYGTVATSLREMFIDRVYFEGPAYAVLFLWRYHYHRKKTKNLTEYGIQRSKKNRRKDKGHFATTLRTY